MPQPCNRFKHRILVTVTCQFKTDNMAELIQVLLGPMFESTETISVIDTEPTKPSHDEIIASQLADIIEGLD